METAHLSNLSSVNVKGLMLTQNCGFMNTVNVSKNFIISCVSTFHGIFNFEENQINSTILSSHKDFLSPEDVS